MFCIKCGKELPNESKFCPFCGTRVPEDKPIEKEVKEEVKTKEGLSQKEIYQKKFTVPQLEESIASLNKNKKLIDTFFIISLVLSLITLGLGIGFAVLSANTTSRIDIFDHSFETPDTTYLYLSTLFFSLFVCSVAPAIALPIINSTVIDKKIAKRKAIIKILQE